MMKPKTVIPFDTQKPMATMDVTISRDWIGCSYALASDEMTLMLRTAIDQGHIVLTDDQKAWLEGLK